MAQYDKQSEQQFEALKENLFTIDWCLKYDKSTAVDWIGDSKLGCLGIPSAILLCSLIDTIGSVFRGTEMQVCIDGVNIKIETVSQHFYILNHDKFFNLNLNMSTIMDLYSTYRSKLIHNSSLPGNNYLSIGVSSDNIFELDSEKKITRINLVPLYDKVKTSIDTLIYYLTYRTFSADHKLAIELESSAKPIISSMKIKPSDTGHTMTIK
jgi:hypothetical protein